MISNCKYDTSLTPPPTVSGYNIYVSGYTFIHVALYVLKHYDTLLNQI